jgi:hypothetical protein
MLGGRVIFRAPATCCFTARQRQLSRIKQLCCFRSQRIYTSASDVGLTATARSAAVDPGLSDGRVPCQSPRKYIQPELYPSQPHGSMLPN